MHLVPLQQTAWLCRQARVQNVFSLSQLHVNNIGCGLCMSLWWSLSLYSYFSHISIIKLSLIATSAHKNTAEHNFDTYTLKVQTFISDTHGSDAWHVWAPARSYNMRMAACTHSAQTFFSADTRLQCSAMKQHSKQQPSLKYNYKCVRKNIGIS